MTGISFVDSTMISVCHNLRCYANKMFKGMATDGKGTIGSCYGFKLHFTCNVGVRKYISRCLRMTSFTRQSQPASATLIMSRMVESLLSRRVAYIL